MRDCHLAKFGSEMKTRAAYFAFRLSFVGARPGCQINEIERGQVCHLPPPGPPQWSSIANPKVNIVSIMVHPGWRCWRSTRPLSLSDHIQQQNEAVCAQNCLSPKFLFVEAPECPICEIERERSSVPSPPRPPQWTPLANPEVDVVLMIVHPGWRCWRSARSPSLIDHFQQQYEVV